MTASKHSNAAVSTKVVAPKGWEDLLTELTCEQRGGNRMAYSYLFRGVTDADHKLIPSLGRHESYKVLEPSSRDAVERRVFEEFRYRFASELHGVTYDDWELLALAQHLGVPTRLLDWSTSPLIALFFALSGATNADRAVYCLTLSKDNNNNEVSQEDRSRTSPFSVNAVRRFSPPLSFPRLRNQRGVFTIQPDPTTELPLKPRKKVIIRRAAVARFQGVLHQYGIDFAYVYPDEEGIGRQVRWHLDTRTGLGPRWPSLGK